MTMVSPACAGEASNNIAAPAIASPPMLLTPENEFMMILPAKMATDGLLLPSTVELLSEPKAD